MATDNNITRRLQRIRTLVVRGHLDAAGEACVVLTEAEPQHAESWMLAGDVAFRRGSREEAIVRMRRAAEYARGDAALLVQLCRFFLSTNNREEALLIARQAGCAPIALPSLFDAVGTLLTHCGDPGAGLAYFDQAVRSAPGNVAFRYNLAMAQRMAGEFEAAEANLDIVLAVDPLDSGAQYARSGLRKQSGDDNHVAELESALGRLDHRPGTATLHFALAKELDDLGEYRQAFAHLTQGCRHHRESYRYNVDTDLAVLDALTRHHRNIRPAEAQHTDASQEPVFVLGLPRSGTTLAERILGSHSQVVAAGELDCFQASAIEAVTKRWGPSVNKLAFVERSLELDIGALGKEYMRRACTVTRGAHRFTDKQPLNYLYAGLIHAALPHSRFVALRRHPVAVCFAMYKTLFASAYPFTYDLFEIARYYVAWDRLIQHWDKELGTVWLTLQYEDLVLSPEKCTRSLLAHCDLPWEASCLQFEQHSTPVATESAVQVRQPLYTDSVSHWRAYEEELRPLQEYLKNAGIEC